MKHPAILAGAMALVLLPCTASAQIRSSVQFPAGYAPSSSPCVKRADGTCVPVAPSNPLPATDAANASFTFAPADGTAESSNASSYTISATSQALARGWYANCPANTAIVATLSGVNGGTAGGVDYNGNGGAASVMNPSLYDANTLWSPHLFIPAPYVLQGANYDSRYRYVHGISWPPVAANKAAVIAAMTTAVNVDSAQTNKSSVVDSLTFEIGYYYPVPEILAWINRQLDIVTRWCAYWGLPPAAI